MHVYVNILFRDFTVHTLTPRHTHTLTHRHLSTYTLAHIHIGTHTHVETCTHSPHAHTHTQTHKYLHTCTYTYIYAHTRRNLYTHTHTHEPLVETVVPLFACTYNIRTALVDDNTTQLVSDNNNRWTYYTRTRGFRNVIRVRNLIASISGLQRRQVHAAHVIKCDDV